MMMPDWSNPKDYDYTKSLDGAGWAWEFLRRNPDYAQDYNALKNSAVVDADGNPPIDLSGSKIGLSRGGGYFLSPPLQVKQTVDQWINQHLIDTTSGSILSPEGYLARKWGLKQCMPDPTEPASSATTKIQNKAYESTKGHVDVNDLFEPIQTGATLLTTMEDVMNLPWASEEVSTANGPTEEQVLLGEIILVAFNAKSAIDPQWDKIATTVRERSNPISPASKKSTAWLNALRAWDAMYHWNVEELSVIGTVLADPEGDPWERGHASMQTAEEMILNKGYREIVHRTFKHRNK